MSEKCIMQKKWGINSLVISYFIFLIYFNLNQMSPSVICFIFIQTQKQKIRKVPPGHEMCHSNVLFDNKKLSIYFKQNILIK
jgi:hypothetical protein